MTELKGNQRDLVEHLEGIRIVDAGPGTGKTTAIVERYVRLIESGVSPEDILLLTFTDNAADEMEGRITERLISPGGDGADPDPEMVRLSKRIMAKTFDSFYHGIVSENAQQINGYFGTKYKLTSSAVICTGVTQNRDHFRLFFDGFNLLNGDAAGYGDYPVILSTRSDDVLSILESLMAKGIVALPEGWFGYDWKRHFIGNSEKELDSLHKMNTLGKKGGRSKICEVIEKMEKNAVCCPPDTSLGVIDENNILEAVNEDRTKLFDYIHDVYLGYIRRCIQDNRLTFGLNAVFAFLLLFKDGKIRERNSFEHVIIDEFQDTNENQLMTSLMIMKKDNLCAVGDLKQGIYGFRYASVDNIAKFQDRAQKFKRFLNADEDRISFEIVENTTQLEYNYRSSSEIVDEAFRVLKQPTDYDEGLDDRLVTKIEAANDGVYKDTHVRYIPAESKDSEAEMTVRCIRSYVTPGRYVVNSEGCEPRNMMYSDIAVLCAKNEGCRKILAALEDAGIPAYLQGDLKIMSMTEGKLALAWLRYINNERDRRGYIPILAYEGYNADFMETVKKDYSNMPPHIRDQRKKLVEKKRRVTDLLTQLFAFYGDRLNRDIAQAIVSALTSQYTDSLDTVSDMINTIKSDIKNGSTYNMEASIDRDAVRIMTMHQSKCMQFQTVIIPYMDSGTVPNTNRPYPPEIRFDPHFGLRYMNEIGHFDGYDKICKSWKSKLAIASKPKNYDEDRKLVFVAMTRAKQYLSLIYNEKAPSPFIARYKKIKDGWTLISGLTKDHPPFREEEDWEEYSQQREALIPIPAVGEYIKRRQNIGVHDILRLKFAPNGSDEVCGKGMEYGTQIHEDAEMLFYGREPEEVRPEHARIKDILKNMSDADLRYSEIEIGLPLPSSNAILKGKVDLMALYTDHIEIIDYKTDAARSDEIEYEYKVQLSVYAHAASKYYRLPAKCRIEYVSPEVNHSEAFKPLTMQIIEDRVKETLYV